MLETRPPADEHAEPAQARSHRSSRRAVPRHERPPEERFHWLASTPFLLVHLVPLLAVFTGVTWSAVVLCLVSFYGRMFFITAGYHRYFAHRSYRMGRIPQFLMAFGGTTATQKGPLWWAGHHRDHHRHSDTDLDVHSPQKGFWWSHVGWILCDKYAHTNTERIKDFAKYPELRFLDRFNWIGPWMLAIASFLVAGWSGLLIGFFLSTVLLWHATFTVNSLAHVIGRRRYVTEDTSRNSALLVLWTMGEGWHNNHHYYQASARQGFFWWELDPSYAILKVLSWVGVVRDLKVPSKQVLQANRVRDGNFDIGMFRNYWGKASRFVHDSSAGLGERVTARRDHAAETVHQRKEALEDFVHESLESAEDLARAMRNRNRDLAVD